MPLVHFFETSFGRTYDRRIMLVTVHCDGLEGWGECVAGEQPFYSEEYIEGAWDVIVRYLAPALLGQTLRRAGRSRLCWRKVREHRMAKAALENAVWDAEAQEKNVPLWKLLGGTRARSPAASASAFRTRTSSCWRRSKPSWPPAISASRSK